MAPLLFALALILQDAPPAAAPSEGPVATAVPRKQDVAPLPIQGGAVSAPADDYGYVAWCYGAVSSYVDLYDRAMPEVIRIERAWPTPGTEENIAKVYPAQRDEARRSLVLFARAMEAAEKASPTTIQPQGQAAMRRGRAVWTGATSVPKAQLAQFWMSWSPPAKCEETARTLESRSLLFGQALTANTRGVITAPPPPPPAEEAAPALVLARPPATTLTAPAAEGPAETPMDGMVSTPDAAPAPAEEAPAPDAAALSAGAADGVLSMTPVATGDTDVATQGADDQGTAIDDLLPAAEPEAAATPAPTAPAAAPTVAKPAPARPAAPAPRKHKRGLKETLTGLRGAQ